MKKNHVILVDMRENSNVVVAIGNDSGTIAKFTYGEAVEMVRTNNLCQTFPYLIINIDSCEVI